MMKKLLAIMALVFILAVIIVSGDYGTEETVQETVVRDTIVEIDVDGDLYIGYSEYRRGYVEAHVVLDNDEIVYIDLIEYNNLGLAKGDDYTYDEFHEAMEVLPQRFLEANDYNIDIVSGATSTSNKAMEAVEMALAKADGQTQFDGTYMGVSHPNGNDWGIAIVKVENGNILEVELEEVYAGELKDDDYMFDTFHDAKEVIAERMVDANDYGVDIYSGATASSDFWIDAAQNAIAKAGYADDIEVIEEYENGIIETENDYKAIGDVYTGYSEFSRGYVEALVELDNDKIIAVNLIEYNNQGIPKDDDYRWDEYHEAMKVLPARFVEANDYNVDIVSGATSTSNKAMDAVKMALAKAAGETQFDGTYMAISDPTSRNAWGIAIVTVEDGNIIDLSLEESNDGELKDEDYSWDEFHEAQEIIAERILEANTYDVDTYSGATSSSNLWIQAVERVLEKVTLN
ncbi:FMN-binding protein [Natronospora cellulosivora (SeqCode)]